MNSILASNDTTESVFVVDSGEAIARKQSSFDWNVGLSRSGYELIHAFVPIEDVDALYAESDADGVLMVFVVVEQHDDEVYEKVLAAESALCERSNLQFELRVRAHQGRNPARAVPVRSLPLFLR